MDIRKTGILGFGGESAQEGMHPLECHGAPEQDAEKQPNRKPPLGQFLFHATLTGRAAKGCDSLLLASEGNCRERDGSLVAQRCRRTVALSE
jgi:hypothetical protein